MELPLTFKATGSVILTDELREYVEERFGKIEKVLSGDQAARADIELGTTGGARTGDAYRAEINLRLTGTLVRAESVADTLHAAIDDAIEEARREAHKHVTKHRDLVRRGAAKVKDLFRYWTGM